MEKKLIEDIFPVNELNNIAAREGAGGPSKKYFRPIYYIHKWWARRLGSVFRTILLYSLSNKNTRYFNKTKNEWEYLDWHSLKRYDLLNNYFIEDINFNGKIILDPFMGGGTTIVEALKMGCKVIGSELNPVAWFLVKKQIELVDIKNLKTAVNTLKKEMSKELLKYYTTKCPSCNNNAEVIYYFWVKELPCLNCKHKIDLFRNYIIAYGKGKEKGKTTVICPNCNNISQTKDNENTRCDLCNHSFNFNEGTISRGFYTCPSCGQKESIIETIKRGNKPSLRMIGTYYFCRSCLQKNYKKCEDYDLSIYKKSVEEFNQKKDNLLYPKQEIPLGYNTKQIINYGYHKWEDLFNERQILTISTLLEYINSLKDENIKELFLLTLSTSLEYYNLLCDYNQKNNFIFNLFKTHAYHPCNTPVENNFYGSTYGFGTFGNFIDKLIKAKEYNINPYEVFYKGQEKIVRHNDTKINAKFAHNFKELEKDKNALLFQGDSSYIDIPDESVDAVITDPPYFDNVMYSELSDFYYVWLREGLKSKYSEFNSELAPKSTEVIKNTVRNKTTQDFIEGLTAVFKEANRVLKNEGILVFTFHHKETEAWGAVLSSVLDSYFYITAIYPIRAEMSTSQHIINKANVEYDMIIVCRKRQEHPEERSWRSIENELYTRVEEEIKKLEKENKHLSKEDIFIITVGKCLELYSKNYPNVMKDGKPLPVQEAVNSIRDIVDSQIMQTRFNQIANELDISTAIYISFLAKVASISFEKLNKQLQQRNISMSEFLKDELVEKEGNSLLVLTPIERVEIILNKKSANLKAIDKAHYLYYLYKKGNLDKDMHDWVDEKTISTLFYLADVTGDEDYRKIAVYVEKHKTQTQLGGMIK